MDAAPSPNLKLIKGTFKLTRNLTVKVPLGEANGLTRVREVLESI